MVRAYRQEHVYKHPWDRVTAANWRKYQDLEKKPLLAHILEVDTISRNIDEDSGKMHTKRLVTVNAPGPWWLQRILGSSICHSVEESTVDPVKQEMEMVTRNVTWKDFVEVEERCWYAPHPENSNWTLFRQQTHIRCAKLSVLASMADKIEKHCVEKFQQNSAKGREVMEQVCSFLEAESRKLNSPLSDLS
ncbi:hypothetical protein O6H91_01G052000 [Diphasiastrum complanatum]|uniref:Uncharacterized protein n=1 Tax=Diphasiastrum complanatum TaxID=34168 RepID=A0ACC2EQY4_DIPCM|nr:hypothetical protein O6H91_01G052000 [Diphasiastrum complanatum]